MEHVHNDFEWSLFNPKDIPDLIKFYGLKFETAFCNYKFLGLAVTVLPAQKLWKHILCLQIESGMPFVLYQDTINSA